MDRLWRRFVYIGLAMLLVLVTGTAGFTVIEHCTPFEAFYMTLTTITTVGYGEIVPLGKGKNGLCSSPTLWPRVRITLPSPK